ncbi:MAG: HlyD family efflux transporter periplasmic adaptor subunit [Chloroflexota bacterium]
MRVRTLNALLLILACLLFVACTGTGGNPEQQAAPTETAIPTAPAVAPPTYLVQRGDVQDILEFSGRWQPRDQLQLSLEIAGTVRRVNVQRGDTVTAGQLLADYQITSLEDQLASAQLQLESAQNSVQNGADTSVQSVADAEIALANAKLSLDSTKAGSPWTSLESARIGLDNAKISLDSAQRNYDDAVSHPENPASTVDSAYQQLQSAQNQQLSAQNSYFSAAQNFNTYQYQIAQAENNVIARQLDLDKARQGGSSTDDQSVRSAQLSIDQINADIARSSLYSPIDGVVLEVAIKPGDAVEAFKTVITIGNPEPKEAIATLSITDANRLSVGLVGVCEIINQPNTAVQCVVRRLPLSSQDADQTTRVAASFDNAPDGGLIQVDMPLEVSQNVLWLPPAAVRTFQNRTFVVLQTPDGPRSVDVQIGLQTDDRVEIQSGVNEGDVVIGQ